MGYGDGVVLLSSSICKMSNTVDRSSSRPRYSCLSLTLMDCFLKDPPQAGSPNYVNVKDALGDAFPARLCGWTNDPGDLQYSYPPDLASSYKIPGLRPIIKHPLEEKFLLADNSGNFYIWVSGEEGFSLMNDHPDLREAIAEAIDNPIRDDLTEIDGPG